MRNRFERLLGPNKVVADAAELASYDDDFSEVERRTPALAVLPSTVEDVQGIVRLAGELRVPLTARVAGTNVAGLAIPAEGGVIVDLRHMNRIHSVDVNNMCAVIEPGVTQQQMRDHLDNNEIPLTLGYSLGPRRSSILANCSMDGLTNRSLKYGSMGEWVAGFEVVLADGSLVRTGSWAVSDLPFMRGPLPDLSGLFVGWQGTTGIITKAGFLLVPKHPFNERLFVLAYSTHGAFEAMRRLCRLEMCDDIGGLSWPNGKMLLGVRRPHPVPEEGEPRFFLYVDLTGNSHEEMAYKRHALSQVIDALRSEGEQFEDPLDVPTLVRMNPAMSKFADFPTDLEFLTDSGGLTWIGTYGPLSRFDQTADDGSALMVKAGFAPAIVSRPMKGGHYGVLRFVAVFDRADKDEIARIKDMNLALLRLVTERGFVMYKTPAWALREMLPHVDPGFLSLMKKVKDLMDPAGILNPGKLLLSP
jgi:FAD/FMN-containing dehydrogenase